MSVIEASSAGVRDMADGSLRITFEFEPRNAAQAYALFGTRGRSVAVAALNDGHAANFEQPKTGNPVLPANQEQKGGELAKLAGIFCQQPEFWEFCNVSNADEARAWILKVCNVESRRELDHSLEASTLFHARVRRPYVESRK